MKFLSQFQEFDFERFAKDKGFMVVGCSPWKEQETNAVLGTKVDTVIYADNTEYKRTEGDTSTNKFEKLSFKVAKAGLNIPVDSIVKPVNPVATIWGEFRNQLSVKCTDMQVAPKRG